MISSGIGSRETFDHDVCVVGSGPVGIAFSIEAVRLGLKVLMLESGSNGPSSHSQELSEAELLDPARHDDMRVAVTRRLGGTSNLWGARCLPLDPIDLTDRPSLVNARWPITWEELSRHFETACRLTCCGSPVFEDHDHNVPPGDPAFRFDTLERWSNIQQSQVAHRTVLTKSRLLDVRLDSTVVGIDFSENGIAEAVRVASGANRIRVPIRRLVIAAGGVESTRLLLAAQREAPKRFGGVDGPLGRYYMGHVIGEIADIILSSDQLDRALDFYVDAYGSYVRRRFVPSEATLLREQILNISMWPVVPHIADARHSSAILSSVYLALAWGPIGRLFLPEALRKRHVPPEPQAILAHIGNVVRGMPHSVAFIARFLRRRYFSRERLPGLYIRSQSRRYGLFYHSEQVPQYESRICLSGEIDRTGLPKAQIALRFSDADARSIVRSHDLFADWLVRNGYGRLEWRCRPEERHASVLSQASHGTHQIGTIRMAYSPRDGIVDRNLRAFDCQNLYVASTAVFPTSGQANPTFTAVALAAALAERLAEENSKCVLLQQSLQKVASHA